MKTDNDSMAAKIALRRYMLDRYHAKGPIDVVDCCQGGGVLWSLLRADYKVRNYWGMDKKKKAGRLKVDSARVLELGIASNVIDIDTYGSPWKHWQALCVAGIESPKTVFLTIGQAGMDRIINQVLGLGALKVPPAISRTLHSLSVRYCLAISYKSDINILEAVEAPRGRSARYIGVRIAPGVGGNG